MRRILLLALAAAPLVHGQEKRTEVSVLGAIHGGHLTSKKYSVDAVVAAVRRMRPQVVLVEIPPDLFGEIVARVDRRGFATTREDVADLTWIRAFPELYSGVLPLRKELGYEVVPVSGWRPEVSEDRRRAERDPAKAKIHDAVEAALAEIREREDDRENPAFLNSQHYADLRHLERACWAACFDDVLGRGGEVAINEAHWANIARALDAHRGRRVLIVYGAAHRYWFLRELRRRADVELVDVRRYLS